ncbi:MAG: protein-L-isoaspartate O-methyltransferase, partial [Betaproteobacteria bacterium]|nr:protein-L-isoaspartate O-methyltransferase [Betaproteobacteria bacterium]
MPTSALAAHRPATAFEQARFNMVEQQIRPWDVLDAQVLESLFAVRREDFVPSEWRSLAFADMEIPLDVSGTRSGEVMLAPKVEARLLQAAAIEPGDRVLEIGTGSGYMAALAACHAAAVISYEIKPDLARFARENLSRAGIRSVEVLDGNGLQACSGSGVFDVVILSGSVSFVPKELIERLADGGRLVAIVGELPVMTAQLITRRPG